MCTCKLLNNKISGMKTKKISGLDTKGIMSNAMGVALGTGGAVAANYLGAMVPDTVDPMYVNIGKIAIGVLAPTLVGGKQSKVVESFGQGMAIAGALALLQSQGVISGFDNQAYALAGYDNQAYALAGAEMYPSYHPEAAAEAAMATD